MTKSNGSNSDLRGFLSVLEGEGELVRVKRDVSAQFELAVITAKVDGKQAVLFEKVHGSKISVAANICGTAKRFYLATAATQNTASNNVKQAIHGRITEAISKLSEPAKAQGEAPFEKNSSKNLLDLPVVTHFAKDA